MAKMVLKWMRLYTLKPEPLKFDMAGCWFRRIVAEHRLVCKPSDDAIVVIQGRYHY